MKIKLLLLLLILNFSSSAFSQVVSIASIRQNDATGVPVLLNQIRTVVGVVTVANQFGGPSYIQDNTAGIAIFDNTFSSAVTIGDSVQVTGTIIQFNGLTELSMVTFNVISSGRTVVPIVINLQQFTTQQWNGLEEYEGRLLRINGLTTTSTGTWAANTNYNVTDATGTYNSTMRIDNNSNLVGAIIPSGTFDCIAVGSQFKSAAPYNSGYQFLPRTTADIIQGGGPIIITNPLESNIQPTSVTISWSTQTPGSSRIRYYLVDSNYQPSVFKDSVLSATMTTNHSLNLTGLKPGKIYFLEVSSTNGTGTSFAPPKYISTSSAQQSTGKMEFYFNRSVDTSLAFPNNKANGNTDFKSRLIQRIDSAVYSIDFAIYSFNDIVQIKDRLIFALIRGVKIRVVYENRENQQLINDLISAGIRVQKRPTTDGLMHNKFMIFDARDTVNPANDWLWGGSANITENQFYDDAQNVFLIQDQAICNTFTREFEEMWGSHTDFNIPARAKFGPEKSRNTPNLFFVNGKKIEVYFSPTENIGTVIEDLITTQNTSLNFCMFAFTRFNIANKMKTVYNPPTRMVRGVFDGGNSSDPVYLEMKGIGGSFPWNPPAKVWLDNVPGQLHHKYMVIDPETPSSNPIVQTGSANYSNNAIFNSDENIVIFYDSLIANIYFQEFSKRISDAGGTIDVKSISSEIPNGFELSQNFPNPFNPVTSINFSIPVKSKVKLIIYDALGREVTTLVNSNLNSGVYNINWNAANYSSGVYFYSLQTESFTSTKKMLLVK
ncbi:MAG: T9SS type A sorting domain-containing protein [Ignavibacteria bacterium]|nr:T9SS type A sorting domain-containing protein [Ignavibacteria bacterium]